jgi:signal peptidase II
MYRYLDLGVYMSLFIALLDQATKWWVQTYVVTPPYITVEVTSWFNFILKWNKGVTFGLLAREEQWMSYAFIAAALLIIAFLLNWMMRAPTMTTALALGLVMGGAIGNVMDRIRYGAVVDFLDVHWQLKHWYTFNVADAAIVCGVCLLLLESVTGEKKKR